MKWEKIPLDTKKARDISNRYGLSLLIASILVRRGITDPEELLFFCEEDVRYFHNPFLFKEMEDVVDRILAAKEEEEKVLIFGDRDVDGITSTALLVKGLSQLGIAVTWKLPMGDDPYGLTCAAVEEFAAEGGTLIVTVDCGISNIREVERASELGIDTLILDHHAPQDVLPKALAIINPKMKDSGYPFEDLAGCGVVAKVIWALAFGETDLSKESFTLLNIRPGNDSYVLEAAILKNLIVEDRITEVLVPGMVQIDQTRLLKFFSKRIFVYDAKTQERMLRKIFGQDAEIYLEDLAPELENQFPGVQGKSLLRLREISRGGRYREQSLSELDVLLNLFTSWVLKKYPRLSEQYRSILDLVAIGTLSDMMPIRNENRLFVKLGLRFLNDGAREGIRELLREQNLSGKLLTSKDISWQIGPAINATGRMGEPDIALRLLLSELPAERETLATGVVELNRVRRKIGDDLWELILPQARDSFEQYENKVVLVCDPRIHRGITGILAARLSNFFNVPAIACSILESKVVGSIRSNRGYRVIHFLERCSDIFQDSGGHEFAAGFNLKREDFPKLEERLRSILPEITLREEEEAGFKVDAEIPPSYMNPKELEQALEFFSPYGEENPPLVFHSAGVQIQSIDFIGRKEQSHTRLLIRAGSYAFPAVFWNSADRVGRDFSVNDHVNIVYELNKNNYQNKETLQLMILDLEKVSGSDSDGK
ncbi:MAG TPA: single-stranded-DNA-specific exonuclease RecJ [Spirochaetales bacterium]|nr:single-stranded-DNA-specific exonuclease RecJ [Spirochaetales bacterium]